MDRWQVTASKTLFDHAWVRIVLDTLTRDSDEWPYLYLDSPVDSVATLALAKNRHILLTRQYRHPIGQIITDLPAGRTQPGEDPLAGARRELEEETGYRPGTIIPLGRHNPFPGSLKVTQHLFFAENLEPGVQNLDPGEELEVHLRPLDEVYEEVLAGLHIDCALQMGLLLARAKGLI